MRKAVHTLGTSAKGKGKSIRKGHPLSLAADASRAPCILCLYLHTGKFFFSQFACTASSAEEIHQICLLVLNKSVVSIPENSTWCCSAAQ